jgi:DNA-binding PadR family transcriptional regulator
MKIKRRQELTPEEYMTLSLVSTEPLDAHELYHRWGSGIDRWKASHAEILGMLIRLKQHGLIVSKVEARPGAVPVTTYHLTPKGGRMLNAWIRQVDEPDLMLVNFLFAEWVDIYEQSLVRWLDHFRFILEGSPWSPYRHRGLFFKRPLGLLLAPHMDCANAPRPDVSRDRESDRSLTAGCPIFR